MAGLGFEAFQLKILVKTGIFFFLFIFLPMAKLKIK